MNCVGLRADFEKRFRIQVVVDDVAVFERHFQAVSVVAIHGIVAQVLDGVAFFLVIHQVAVEIGFVLQAAQVVFAEHLRILAARRMA